MNILIYRTITNFQCICNLWYKLNAICFMRTAVTQLLVLILIFQIGCSSITQISYPVEQSKSENEIRQLNYFGEKLSSTIQFTNQVEVEAYWLNLRENNVYFLTEELDHTSSVGIDKINTIRFYDMYGGCMKGGLLGFGISGLETLILWVSLSGYAGDRTGLGAVLIAYPITIFLSILYGVFFMGEREFNFVLNKSVRD